MKVVVFFTQRQQCDTNKLLTNGFKANGPNGVQMCAQLCTKFLIKIVRLNLTTSLRLGWKKLIKTPQKQNSRMCDQVFAAVISWRHSLLIFLSRARAIHVSLTLWCSFHSWPISIASALHYPFCTTKIRIYNSWNDWHTYLLWMSQFSERPPAEKG